MQHRPGYKGTKSLLPTAKASALYKEHYKQLEFNPFIERSGSSGSML
jgi:hypothetical protein